MSRRLGMPARPVACAMLAALVLSFAAGCGSLAAQGPASRAGCAAVAPHPPSGPEAICSGEAQSPGDGLDAIVLRGTSDASLCEHLRSRAGEPLDEGVAAEDLARLFATQRFDDVAVVVESDETAEVLVFELVLRPRLERVVVEGLPESLAGAARGLVADHPPTLTPVWVREARAKLAGELERHGHAIATVEHRVVPGEPGGVVLIYDVEPGARFVLRDLRIEGAKALRPADFLPALRMVRGEPVDRDLLERDRLAAVAVLLDRGFVQGVVSAELRVDREGAAIDAVFDVSEGDRYRLGEVRIDAAMKLPEARYATARERLKKGAWFSRAQIAEAVAEIERIHRDAGLPRRARPEATVRGREIDVVFHLEDP